MTGSHRAHPTTRRYRNLGHSAVADRRYRSRRILDCARCCAADLTKRHRVLSLNQVRVAGGPNTPKSRDIRCSNLQVQLPNDVAIGKRKVGEKEKGRTTGPALSHKHT